eukprot:CAMPEP_0174878068 /NCGR_PEP_ID=MMETSP1114-20130205/82568_1 /TAXON_ID=312471 /ORGANISM="Neobodo designis, Strain CCAP 1951/1" /LENGTH=496 /DNA_ID=CAMNT_0016113455 /DNA_START=440 /DNA_END=1929 /DNA_ORIENTATION=-
MPSPQRRAHSPDHQPLTSQFLYFIGRARHTILRVSAQSIFLVSHNNRRLLCGKLRTSAPPCVFCSLEKRTSASAFAAGLIHFSPATKQPTALTFLLWILSPSRQVGIEPPVPQPPSSRAIDTSLIGDLARRQASPDPVLFPSLLQRPRETPPSQATTPTTMPSPQRRAHSPDHQPLTSDDDHNDYRPRRRGSRAVGLARRDADNFGAQELARDAKPQQPKRNKKLSFAGDNQDVSDEGTTATDVRPSVMMQSFKSDGDTMSAADPNDRNGPREYYYVVEKNQKGGGGGGGGGDGSETGDDETDADGAESAAPSSLDDSMGGSTTARSKISSSGGTSTGCTICGKHFKIPFTVLTFNDRAVEDLVLRRHEHGLHHLRQALQDPVHRAHLHGDVGAHCDAPHHRADPDGDAAQDLVTVEGFNGLAAEVSNCVSAMSLEDYRVFDAVYHPTGSTRQAYTDARAETDLMCDTRLLTELRSIAIKHKEFDANRDTMARAIR